MNFMWVPFAVWLAVDFFAVDGYIWRCLRRRMPARPWAAWVHIAVAVLLLAMGIVLLCLDPHGARPHMFTAMMWLMFIYMSVYSAKIVWVAADLVSQLPRLWGRRPARWLSWAGAAVALAWFGAAWWGAAAGRFRLKVAETEVEMAGLPRAFDGYRIVQLSDMHLGTYGTDTAFVSKIVDTANALRPDMIVFTGDLVNRTGAELPPFMPVLSRLKAPDGVVAILGNHDHMDYGNDPDEASRLASVAAFCAAERAMGWRLLLDSTLTVSRGAGQEKLQVVGVQNIGEGRFPVYGSLRRACPPDSLDPAAARILLTHNPRHWNDSIANRPGQDFGLTLAGHTHAMQMSLGRLSPAALRYPQWGGLYTDTLGRAIYVSPGTGTVGMPARIGATPEISVITLRSKP